MAKTVRRDVLLRKARAGKLVAVESLSFCDMTGQHEWGGELPVNVRENGGAYDHSRFNVHVSEFSSGCGRAWENSDGTVTLYVHSNSSYTFKVLS